MTREMRSISFKMFEKLRFVIFQKKNIYSNIVFSPKEAIIAVLETAMCLPFT